MIYLGLILSLAIILFCADTFTNAVEWLGKKLNLAEGAVGSVLAAVGTALPETMIPLIAILFGTSEESTHIGIGAILGAPLMLATLAMFVTGLARKLHKRQDQPSVMLCNSQMTKRDLKYFIVLYSLAIFAALLPNHSLKMVVAVALVGGYIWYVKQTLRDGECLGEMELHPLRLQKNNPNPGLPAVVFQLLLSLGGIVFGAHLFVQGITEASMALGIPVFVLSLVVAPIATELPEKFNSIVWVRQGKDTLALGNITGAMVFQGSLITAIGIALTPWELSPLALASGLLALAASMFILFRIRKRGHILSRTLITAGSLYLLFVGFVVYSGGAL